MVVTIIINTAQQQGVEFPTARSSSSPLLCSHALNTNTLTLQPATHCALYTHHSNLAWTANLLKTR